MVEFRCPVHHEPLDQHDPARWVGIGHGEVYPVLDGIPILLPNRAERDRVAQTDWSKPVDSSQAIDFYNDARFEKIYSTDQHESRRIELTNWVARAIAPGPVLEIGSGRGALQGIGQEYVALDYAFTALRRNIDPKYARVCGTADRLPFADGSFAVIFTVDALEHVPRADLAFDEIHRVLRPGGVAFLLPAWHCVQWICDGVRRRPYRELSLRQKWWKATIPLRASAAVKAAGTLPRRILRRLAWQFSGAKQIAMPVHQLHPEYKVFWESDCDACSRLDSHDAAVYFKSRGYENLSIGEGAMRQLLARHEPIVVKKRA